MYMQIILYIIYMLMHNNNIIMCYKLVLYIQLDVVLYPCLNAPLEIKTHLSINLPALL